MSEPIGIKINQSKCIAFVFKWSLAMPYLSFNFHSASYVCINHFWQISYTGISPLVSLKTILSEFYTQRLENLLLGALFISSTVFDSLSFILDLIQGRSELQASALVNEGHPESARLHWSISSGEQAGFQLWLPGCFTPKQWPEEIAQEPYKPIPYRRGTM